LIASLLFLGAFFQAPPAESFRAETRNGIHITTECYFPKALHSGFVPIRIRLENMRDEPVALEVLLYQGYWDRAITQGSLTLEPGESRRLDWRALYWESLADESVDLQVIEGGKTIARWEILQTLPNSALSSHIGLVVVGEKSKNTAEHLNGRKFARSSASPQLISASSLPSGRAPTDWRAWSSLRVVVVASHDTTLSPDALRSLGEWTSLGGFLVVEGAHADALALLRQAEIPLEERLGSSTDMSEVYRHGFGRVTFPRNSALAWELLDDVVHWDFSFTPANGPFPSKLSLLDLPIPGLLDIPVRFFILLLIIFAFCVGPGQFLYLKKKRKSAFTFLLFTPALGLSFTVVLLGWPVLSQGLHVKDRVASITWLHQESHTASTILQRSTFSGSRIRKGAHYQAGTAVIPKSSALTDQKDSFVINMDQAGSLTGRYFPVRVPFEEQQANVRTARNQVVIRKEGELLFASHNFDTKLSDFFFHDSAGQWWKPGEMGSLLEQAQHVPLQLCEEPEPLKLQLLSSSNLAHLPTHIPTNTWVAWLEHSPFVDDGEIERSVVQSQNLTFGLLSQEQSP